MAKRKRTKRANKPKQTPSHGAMVGYEGEVRKMADGPDQQEKATRAVSERWAA